MAITRSVNTANDPKLGPVFSFKTYERSNAPFFNNSRQIDFVTWDGNLYVCVDNSDPKRGVSYKAGNPANNGFLLLIKKGENGQPGAPGAPGKPGPMPEYSLKFDGKQLVIIDQNGVRKAVSPELTGPSWFPELQGHKIIWKRKEADDTSIPQNIDLDELRPIEECPILLRLNSDNTKREAEKTGPGYYIQWKREGADEWTNLMSISELMNIALAGVCFWWDDAKDGSTDINGNPVQTLHFGHKQVIEATYDASKLGNKRIADVTLGDVLFDAGEIPFANYDDDIAALNAYLCDLQDDLTATKASIPTKVSQLINDVPFIKTVNGHHPNTAGELKLKTVDNIDLVGESNIPFAKINGRPIVNTEANFEIPSDYLTARNLKTIAGQYLIKGSDSDGNISLRTINGEFLIGTAPINVGTVRSVNNITPDSNGNVNVNAGSSFNKIYKWDEFKNLNESTKPDDGIDKVANARTVYEIWKYIKGEIGDLWDAINNCCGSNSGSGGGSGSGSGSEPFTPTLYINPTSGSHNYTAGSVSFNVYSNISWKASSNNATITSGASGDGNGVVTISFPANSGSTPIVYTVTVSADNYDNQATYILIQSIDEFVPQLSINPTNGSKTNASGSGSINVSSNVAWSATASNGIVITSGASGSVNGTINFTYPENTSYNEIQRSIVVSANNYSLSSTYILKQSGKPQPYLYFDPDSNNAGSASGTGSANVKSNVAWTATADGNITITSSASGNNDGTISFSYIENESENPTVSHIYIVSGDLNDTYTFTQAGKPVEPTISVDSDEIELDPEGETAYVDVISSDDWDFTVNEDWLTVTKENNSTLKIIAGVNEDGVRRTAVINVCIDNDHCATIFVGQDPYEEPDPGSGSGSGSGSGYSCDNQTISVNNANVSLAASGDSDSVDITASDDWDYTVSGSNWLSVNRSGDTLTFSASENNDGDRSATVTVYIINCEGTTAEIEVSQVVKPYLRIWQLSPNGFGAKPGGIAGDVRVEANVPWTMSADEDWINIGNIYSDETGFDFTVDDNAGNYRTGNIIVTATDNSGLSDSREIYQMGVEESGSSITSPEVTLNPSSIVVPYDGKGSTYTINVTVTGSEGWTIDSSTVPDWVTISNSDNNSFTIEITGDAELYERDAHISVCTGSGANVACSTLDITYEGVTSYDDDLMFFDDPDATDYTHRIDIDSNEHTVYVGDPLDAYPKIWRHAYDSNHQHIIYEDYITPSGYWSGGDGVVIISWYTITGIAVGQADLEYICTNPSGVSGGLTLGIISPYSNARVRLGTTLVGNNGSYSLSGSESISGGLFYNTMTEQDEEASVSLSSSDSCIDITGNTITAVGNGTATVSATVDDIPITFTVTCTTQIYMAYNLADSGNASYSPIGDASFSITNGNEAHVVGFCYREDYNNAADVSITGPSTSGSNTNNIHASASESEITVYVSGEANGTVEFSVNGYTITFNVNVPA